MLKKISITKYLSMFLLIICSLFLLNGCNPAGNPKKTITDYVTALNNNDNDTAYSLLSDQNKKDFTKEDFIEYRDLYNEIRSNAKDSIISSEKYQKGYKNFSISYPFNVRSKYKNIYGNKIITEVNKYYVVPNKKNTWSIYLDINLKGYTSFYYINYGHMYQYGKGEEIDLNQAAIYYKMAIEKAPEFSEGYYALGDVYFELNRYDDSINAEKICIKKSSENIEKSDAYNILGLDYQNKGEIVKAVESFQIALGLNPDNEYAKTNLEAL